MRNNLALDQTTGDLLEVANQIKQVTELDSLAQAIYSDLKTFLGEYWLNKKLGVPYFQVIFVKSIDLSFKKTLMKNEIFKREEVLEILSFQADFIGATRTFKISFSAKTTLGIIENQEIIL
jgi:hypothetical protein